MIVAGSASPLLLSSAGGYNLTNSLRFRSSASAYLNRTPASAGNRQIWTYSALVKRGVLGQDIYLLTGESGSNNDEYSYVYIKSDEGIRFVIGQIGSNPHLTNSAAVFRDPSAWYHIVSTFDSTQATAANRWRLYVNGVEQTMSGTVMSQNYNSGWINNNSRQGIMGRLNYATNTSDGYMAEVNFIDGQALTPSSFGETSSTTGVWIPKKYTGTYGTNGFYLPFTDNSALTTSSNVGLGKDFSGNANYWTTNNISITSGSTYDSMTDVPTLTSTTTANYAVLNPLDYNSTYLTLSAGNLQQTYGGLAAAAASRATMVIPTTGKYYWEITLTTIGTNNTTIRAGICSPTTAISGNSIDNASTAYLQITNGQKRNNATDSTYGAGFSNGQILQVLYDATAGSIYFGQNDSYANGSGSFNQTFSNATAAFTGLSGEFMPCFITYGGSDIAVNFGQRPFAYTPPTGFVGLNTFNLPTPTIGATASTTANKYFDINTYTGDGSQTASFTNSGSMQPDMVWSRIRSGTPQAIGVFDSVRGTTGQSLDTAATTAEGTWNGALSSEYGYVSAFNSNGFSVNDGSVATTGGYVNFSGRTYVGWQWRASNATAVTNTAGSITSTVSANTSAGFSIVTATTPASYTNYTAGHGLGVTPSMIIYKERTGTSNWWVWHTSFATASNALQLNTTGGILSGGYFGTQTDTVVAFSGVQTGLSTGFVAYCFAQIAGYSAFGSYTGNGDPNGAFVYLGFRPKFVLIKSTASGTNWVLHDSSREPFNEMGTNSIGYALNTENSAVESTNANLWAIDFTSNGFKNRSSSASVNSSGQTYIYMAFAENPFKYANAK